VANAKGIPSNVIYLPVQAAAATVTLGLDSIPIERGVVTVADFNGGGTADILVDGAYAEGTYYIDTYLGDGRAGFSKVRGGRQDEFGAAVEWPNPVADFNHDGTMDLALVSGIEAPVVTQIFLGDGAGKVNGVKLSVDGEGVAADINGDGTLDLVTNAADGFFNYLHINVNDKADLSSPAVSCWVRMLPPAHLWSAISIMMASSML
jgi:hypothetical protein